MHCRPQLWHGADDDALRAAALEQGERELADGLPRRALAHADQDIAFANRHNIAAFERGEAPVLGRVAPPDVDLAGEVWVEFVDGGREYRLLQDDNHAKRYSGDADTDIK